MLGVLSNNCVNHGLQRVLKVIIPFLTVSHKPRATVLTLSRVKNFAQRKSSLCLNLKKIKLFLFKLAPGWF